MKSDRLLSALLLLQARGRVTERELAERLEVSQRTVHRDMEALSAARVPISAIRGSQGGWELEKGWRTHVPGLDESELRALLMAQPRALGHSRLAAAMRERLHVDPTGWRGTGEDLSMLAAVQEAVAANRKLAFDYTRADGQTGPRTVEPLGVVAKGLTWYLVARGANGIRTYRVSRMAAVTALASRFERPAGFDLAAHWKESTTKLGEQRGQFTVILCVTVGASRRLREWGMTRQVDGEAESMPEGWVQVTASFDNEDEARFFVLGLGTRARVLSPDEFRKCIAEEAAAVAEAG
jgi:predicted DNA-binding transcriptional regulator YafY